jgi:hypothetical protein
MGQETEQAEPAAESNPEILHNGLLFGLNLSGGGPSPVDLDGNLSYAYRFDDVSKIRVGITAG